MPLNIIMLLSNIIMLSIRIPLIVIVLLIVIIQVRLVCTVSAHPIAQVFIHISYSYPFIFQFELILSPRVSKYFRFCEI